MSVSSCPSQKLVTESEFPLPYYRVFINDTCIESDVSYDTFVDASVTFIVEIIIKYVHQQVFNLIWQLLLNIVLIVSGKYSSFNSYISKK